MRSLYDRAWSRAHIIVFMVPSIEAAEYINQSTTEEIPASTRVVSVVLTEEEWRAFRAIEPEPLAWIQQQIRTRVERAASAAYEDDDY